MENSAAARGLDKGLAGGEGSATQEPCGTPAWYLPDRSFIFRGARSIASCHFPGSTWTLKKITYLNAVPTNTLAIQYIPDALQPIGGARCYTTSCLGTQTIWSKASNVGR